MRRFFVSAVLSILFIVSMPQAALAQQVNWLRQFGTARGDLASAVASDRSGVYIVGVTMDENDSGGWIRETADAFIRKYDSLGNLLWADGISTCDVCGDTLADIAVNTSGVYVVGNTDGTLPGQAAGSGSAFIRKYDANGVQVWTRQFGAAGPDFVRSVALRGTRPVIAGQTGNGMFIASLDAAGEEQWRSVFGTGSAEGVESLAVNRSGIYASGWTFGVFPEQEQQGQADAFVAAFLRNGTPSWTQQWGTPGQDAAHGVAADDTGIYAAGVFFDYPTAVDAYVRRYDSAGNVVWSNTFGTPNLDATYGVVVTRTGVSVAGLIDTAPGLPPDGTGDAYIATFDTSGTELWALRFGTVDPGDVATAISASGRTLYAVGYTRGTFVGEASAGLTDSFVVAVR